MKMDDLFIQLMIKVPFGIIFYFITFRLMGRKEVSQQNALDYGFAVLMASIAWDMSNSEDYTIPEMIITFAVVAFILYLLDWVTARNRKVERVLIGDPIVLVKNGVINDKALEQERISVAELKSRLRVLGVWKIEQIEVALLEVSGQISVKKRQ